MKLRDKLEISTLKAKEKQQEIDEGKKLAKAIEVLRETRVKEEANLRKFRDESMKLIVSEVKSKMVERDHLNDDILGLRIIYNNLREKIEKINNQIINL